MPQAEILPQAPQQMALESSSMGSNAIDRLPDVPRQMVLEDKQVMSLKNAFGHQ